MAPAAAYARRGGQREQRERHREGAGEGSGACVPLRAAVLAPAEPLVLLQLEHLDAGGDARAHVLRPRLVTGAPRRACRCPSRRRSASSLWTRLVHNHLCKKSCRLSYIAAADRSRNSSRPKIKPPPNPACPTTPARAFDASVPVLGRSRRRSSPRRRTCPPIAVETAWNAYTLLTRLPGFQREPEAARAICGRGRLDTLERPAF